MGIPKFIGTVCSLKKDRAYGYLTPSWAINGDDNIFFHFSRTVPKKCFLEQGKEVLFQLEKDNKGRWMAINLLDTAYSRPEVIHRAKLMKSRPDFLPDSCLLREDRQRVKKEDARVDRAKKEDIINKMEEEVDTTNFVASLISSKEV